MASTIWKGHLTFGLISVPIKLHSASRSEALSFNMLRASDHARVKQVLMIDDAPVSRTDLVKGFEYEKDKYVVLSDAEIESAAPESKRTVEVLEFVSGWEVNPVFLESAYYITPDAAGSEKSYALLFKALQKSRCVAVAKITMHNREHVVIVGAGEHGLLMHTLYYADEVRQIEEFRTDCSAVKANELKMAITLIKAMQAKFSPEKFKDRYRESLLQLIQDKVDGNETQKSTETSRQAPVIDVMTALKQSLKKNHPQIETAAPAASMRDAMHVSEKPHTNAHHTARTRHADIRSAGGSPERHSERKGDPIREQRGRGLSPHGHQRSGPATPKRSISGGKKRVLLG